MYDGDMPVKDELLNGVVESSGVYREFTDREITKLFKVVSVIRTPDTLIAQINLKTGDVLRDIAIDEPTVRALAKVFEDFRRDHPTGKAPVPPPGTFARQEEHEEEGVAVIKYEDD